MVSLMLLPLVWSLVAAGCPNGFVPHDDRCYTRVSVRASWAEATVYCQAIAAELVEVETEAENTFLTNWLKTESSTVADHLWMGGQDLLVEGEYRWSRTDTKIQKFWWAAGQPNNNNNEDCMIFSKDNQFLWDEDACYMVNHFICEKQGDGAVDKIHPIGKSSKGVNELLKHVS